MSRYRRLKEMGATRNLNVLSQGLPASDVNPNEEGRRSLQEAFNQNKKMSPENRNGQLMYRGRPEIG